MAMRAPREQKRLIIIVSAMAAAAIVFVAAYSATHLRPPAEVRKMQEAQEQKVADTVKSADFAQCLQYDGKIINGADYGIVCRNNIAINLALKNLDTSWCSKLDGKLMSKVDCEERVLAGKFSGGSDRGICGNASSDAARTFCLDFYWNKQANFKVDSSLCVNLSTDAYQAACKRRVDLARFLAGPSNIDCTTLFDGLPATCKKIQAEFKTNKTLACVDLMGIIGGGPGSHPKLPPLCSM